MTKEIEKITTKVVEGLADLGVDSQPRDVVSALLAITANIMKQENIPTFEIARVYADSILEITQIAVMDIGLDQLPQIGTEWMESATDRAFVVVNVTNVLGAVSLVDNPIQIVYRDMEGNVWSMPLADWNYRMIALQTE